MKITKSCYDWGEFKGWKSFYHRNKPAANLYPEVTDRTHLGHEVEMACDGDEGIELIESGYKCDLVITDITMPRLNGNAVARHIRSSDRQDTPIVAITGLVRMLLRGNSSTPFS